MNDQPTACRTTRHCADHGFCHRCTPSLDDATAHLVEAIDAAGIEYPTSSRVYAQLAATVRDAARTAARQTTGQDDAEQRVAKLEAEIARLHDEHKASLRRADQVNAELMQEVQRYAAGTERPVLWSVYNQMHNRALTAEAKLAAAPAVGQPAEAHDTEARPPRVQWRVEGYDADVWLPVSRSFDSSADAHARKHADTRYPDVPTRVVRETTTWTVEDER